MRSEERRVGKEWRSLCDWSSDVCSSDLLFDKVFHLYWYSPGQWRLFSTYGYPQPVWVMSAYVLYYCIPGLYMFHRLERGASREWAFKAALVTALYEIGRASCRERVEITV